MRGDEEGIKNIGPRELSEATQICIGNGRPLMIWGQPGIGKSAVIKQICQELSIDLIDMRLLNYDPVDLRGVPSVVDAKTKWNVPDFFPEGGSGILFLDEINAAPPAVQASAYQLIFDRQLGDYYLPDGWAIVAAGNRIGDRAVVHQMPSALANRFIHVCTEVRNEDWQDWAVNNGIDERVIGMLNWRKDLINTFNPKQNNTAFATPRTWHYVSDILHNDWKHVVEKMKIGNIDLNSISDDGNPFLKKEKERNDITTIQRILIEGCVGAGVAAEFFTYINHYQELPDIDKIFANPTKSKLPDADKKPALIWAIISSGIIKFKNAEADKLDNVLELSMRFPPEFAVALVSGLGRINNNIVQSSKWEKWFKKYEADI